MSADSEDAEFLAWVRAHGRDCDHATLTKALANTEHLVRRPRRLRAEYWRSWIRAVVAYEMETNGKLDAAVVAAGKRLEASERTVWTALAPAPAAPALSKARFLKIVAENLEIAERSGNRQAAEFLRRQLEKVDAANAAPLDTITALSGDEELRDAANAAKAPSRFEHSSLQSK